MIDQACKVRPKIINLNSNEPVFYPFSIKISKCSGSCNNINDPYAQICVPDVVKSLNIKFFNLELSRTIETRHINGTKRISVNVDQMQVFVIISNVRMMINVDAYVKN